MLILKFSFNSLLPCDKHMKGISEYSQNKWKWNNAHVYFIYTSPTRFWKARIKKELVSTTVRSYCLQWTLLPLGTKVSDTFATLGTEKKNDDWGDLGLHRRLWHLRLDFLYFPVCWCRKPLYVTAHPRPMDRRVSILEFVSIPKSKL